MIGGFVLLVGLILVVGGIIWYISDGFRDEIPNDQKKFRKGGIAVSIAGVIVGIFAFGIHQVDAGFVGVVRNFGAVTGGTIQPGLTWLPPFIYSVEGIDTRVRQIRIENYAAASKEQQDLFMNLTLNYHVKPDQAPAIVQGIGSDFEAKIVQPRFLDIPKSVTDDYPTTTVLNSRDEIRLKATELLTASLAPYGFVVDGLALENFGYSAEYNQAIEQKQIEQQRVETEKQKLEQSKIAAQTAVEVAKGTANAQIERARGEAEANKLVSASLTDEILTNRYIEKIGPDVKAILVPADGGFILDLGEVLKPVAP